MPEDLTTLPEDVLTREKPAAEKLADQAVKTAIKQIETSIKSRTGRFDDIAKNEALYYGQKSKALRGRNNVPFDEVLARGYVDALHGKIDEKLQISFERAPGRQQDKSIAQKITAVCNFESGADQGGWNIKDLGVKKLAIFSGRGIYKKYSARKSDGTFCDYFEEVDHWDFYTEPQGGGNLDRHLWKGQMNIFRSAEELRSGAKEDYYNARQVEKLIRLTDNAEQKKNEEIYRNKVKRAASVGIDYDTNSYVGSKLFRLTEHVMYFRGKWYCLVFNYDHGIWVRFTELEKMYSVAKVKPGRGPWISWATHYDPFEFWSIGPMDSVRPIAYAMKKVMNLALDNLEKRNWHQRAYDPNVFNPKDLIFKHDGLAKANIRVGQSIGNHIYTFETPDTTSITVNLTEWLDNFLGRNTGITAEARGKSDQDKVGIYLGDLQQVADRLGLTNKMYEQAHVDLGVNFQYGLIDHMPEKYAVQVIGNEGIEWNEELKREEIQGKKFMVRVRGTNAEEKLNQVLMQRKQNALLGVQKDPALRGRVNSTWYLREWLTLGGYEPEDVRVALDTNNDADDDLLAEAAGAIEEIIAGRMPKKNRGATTGFIRKIVDYAWDTEGLTDAIFNQLIAYAKAHIPIAQYNGERKQLSVLATGGVAQDGKEPLSQGTPDSMMTPPGGPEMPGPGREGAMAPELPAGPSPMRERGMSAPGY